MIGRRSRSALSATAFRRRILGARITTASAEHAGGRIVALKLRLESRGSVRIEAAASTELHLEEIDERTYAAGGRREGRDFARLIDDVIVDDVSILGVAHRASAVVLNPGPPRSWVVRAHPFPQTGGGLAFFGTAQARGKREPEDRDSFNLLTGELNRSRASSSRHLGP